MNFKLFDTEICISFSFLLMMSAFLLLDTLHSGWVVIGSVAIHELAHITAMKSFGVKVEKLSLLPIGVRIKKHGGGTISYIKEAVIYLSGPIASLFLALLFFVLNIPVGFAVNLLLALFNLLPIMPLDGGQAVLVICKSLGCNVYAEKISCCISLVMLLPLAIGAIILWKTTDNFSLILTVFFLAAGLLPKALD